MLDLIISFFKKREYPFNKDYRNGYRNAWINNLKNYKP